MITSKELIHTENQLKDLEKKLTKLNKDPVTNASMIARTKSIIAGCKEKLATKKAY